jgi:S1-C subfamily serine protease
MKRVILALAALCLSACVSTQSFPDYSELASQTVPSNVQLLGTFTNWRTGETKVDAVFCSGTVVSETQIYTAGHCVDSKEVRQEDGRIKVRLHNGRIVLAKVVKFAFSEEPGKEADSALLEINSAEGGYLPHAATKGDSRAVRQGDFVAVVGNSFGELVDSFAVGFIQYARRQTNFGVYHQIDAHIAGGNSGGGVFNAKGELIGMLTRGGGGFAFVIPLDITEAELASAVNKPFEELRFKAKRQGKK